MALAPIVFSNIMEGQMLAMLDIDYATSMGRDDSKPDPTGFPDKWASAYFTYSLDGEVKGATNEGGDKSILSSYFEAPGLKTPDTFAIALADYWHTVAITPGPPFWGDAPISVSNNAKALVPLFKAAIEASMGSGEKKPYYLHLIDNIENIAVKEIIWTVTEVLALSTTTNTAKIDE